MGLEILGYPASLVMGLALGLTGGGGAILIMPILVYLFGVGAIEATTYSLSLVGLVAFWGALNAYRSKDLHLPRAMSFAVPGVLGVLTARKILLPMMPQEMQVSGFTIGQNSMLLVIFSILMLLSSASMIRSSLSNPEILIHGRDDFIFDRRLLVVGYGVGLLAGFVGAGGGFLIVPALVNIGKLDMKQSVGTSLFVIAIQSTLGVLADYRSLQQIDFSLFISIAVLSLVGMILGIRLKSRISQPKLKLDLGFLF